MFGGNIILHVRSNFVLEDFHCVVTSLKGTLLTTRLINTKKSKLTTFMDFAAAKIATSATRPMRTSLLGSHPRMTSQRQRTNHSSSTSSVIATSMERSSPCGGPSPVPVAVRGKSSTSRREEQQNYQSILNCSVHSSRCSNQFANKL